MEIRAGFENISSTYGGFTARAPEQTAVRTDSPVPVSEASERHGIHRRDDHALAALRHELRASFKASFKARFAAFENAYAGGRDANTPDDIADEALGVARQAVAENPAEAPRVLVSFRSRVHQVAQFVQQTVAPAGGSEDVDAVVGQVDAGLDEMEQDVASNREASTSVVEMDLRSKQRSTIKIRTQEGDVVRFDLKQRSSLSASQEVSGDETVTEVEASTKTKMLLRVKGELNEAEMSAIQGVFEQAEAIASQFFDGDIAAALSLVDGLEFDAEQLAGVRMGFRSQQVSNFAFSGVVTEPEVVPADDPVALPPVDDAAAPPADDAAASVVNDAPAAPVDGTAFLPADDTTAAPEDDSSAIHVIRQPGIVDFFEAVSSFLRSVSEGFTGESAGGEFRLHFSESFKLNILQAVIHTVAPEDAQAVADNAVALVDGIAESDEAAAA